MDVSIECCTVKDKTQSQGYQDKEVQIKHRKQISTEEWISVSCLLCVAQIEVSATGQSHVQGSPTVCVCETYIML